MLTTVFSVPCFYLYEQGLNHLNIYGPLSCYCPNGREMFCDQNIAFYVDFCCLRLDKDKLQASVFL